MLPQEKRYHEFKDSLKPLREAQSLLGWDLRTRAPKGSYENKLEAMSYFSSELFKKNTSEEYKEILRDLKAPGVYEELPVPMQITVDRELKGFEENSRIPADFYKEFTRMRAKCEKVWEEAKAGNDFASFEPWLQKNIDMTREYMAYRKPGMETMDALLSQWMDGVSGDMIEKLFADTKEALVPLIRRIEEKKREETAKGTAPDLTPFKAESTLEQQDQVQHFLLEYVGFDFNRGTTGVSAHGLTSTIDENDIRITGSYAPYRTVDSMFTAIHEGGHGIYAQSTDPSLLGTACASLIYSDIHESQSRFLENNLGRNINFWVPIYDKITRMLPQLKGTSLEDFERVINDVKVSEVRTEADEVTYALHIILRFEIEKAIFREGVKASELPALWNQKMEEMLGVTPRDDTHGILQDLHWSSVYFGYFPTYLLGSIYDGMYLEALTRDLGDIDRILREGGMDRIAQWIKENMMKHGSLYNAPELIKKLTGKEISAQPMIDYFTEKYTRIFHLE